MTTKTEQKINNLTAQDFLTKEEKDLKQLIQQYREEVGEGLR